MDDKPRVNFCWQCGKKLREHHHKIIVVDNFEKVVHKSCAKELASGEITCRTSGEISGPWHRDYED